jgi:phospholysine phosphohistidine inorganic pyrophosphate phosphatase
MRAILFDIDGVLLQNGNAIDGAAATLSWVQAHAIPFRLLTNTTSRCRADICAALNSHGLRVSESHIITPPVAARQWLQQQQCERVELLVPDGIRGEFAVADASPAVDAIVVGDLGSGFTFERLNNAFRTLMDNPQAALVALGMTRYFAGSDGLQLDVGPFIKALEYASGRQAQVMGKPAAEFFRLALDELGVPAAQALMIGDDRLGDVLGAQACGINGCLVRTGKYRPGDERVDRDGLAAQYVLDSVADLPALWARLQ